MAEIVVPTPHAIDREKVKNWAKTLSLQVNRAVLAYDVTSEVGYDVSRLSEDMQAHPSMVAYWSSVAAKLEKGANLAKMELRRLRGELAGRTRRSLTAQGRKPTDATVQEVLDSDPKLCQAEGELYEVQERLRQVKGILEALRARKEMLLQEAQNRLRSYYGTRDLE